MVISEWWIDARYWSEAEGRLWRAEYSMFVVIAGQPERLRRPDYECIYTRRNISDSIYLICIHSARSI